jgi:hypothetical protein
VADPEKPKNDDEPERYAQEPQQDQDHLLVILLL